MLDKSPSFVFIRRERSVETVFPISQRRYCVDEVAVEDVPRKWRSAKGLAKTLVCSSFIVDAGARVRFHFVNQINFIFEIIINGEFRITTDCDRNIVVPFVDPVTERFAVCEHNIFVFLHYFGDGSQDFFLHGSVEDFVFQSWRCCGYFYFIINITIIIIIIRTG